MTQEEFIDQLILKTNALETTLRALILTLPADRKAEFQGVLLSLWDYADEILPPDRKEQLEKARAISVAMSGKPGWELEHLKRRS